MTTKPNMTEWTDPRPRYPTGVVLVKCDDDSVRYATHSRYVGWCEFPGGICDRWSMAHPEIVGWKPAHWPPENEEEFAAASRRMEPKRVAEWRAALISGGKLKDVAGVKGGGDGL